MAKAKQQRGQGNQKENAAKPERALTALVNGSATSNDAHLEAPKRRWDNGKSASAPRKESPHALKKLSKKKSSSAFRASIAAVCVGILSVGAYYLFAHLEEQKILSPFAGPLIPYDRSYKNSLLWGTYRSGLYFGVRSRTPDSLEMGLMWFPYSGGKLNIRHLCDQNDRLRYGWLDHDGRSFGYQEILDDFANISTSFVKRFSEQTNDWVARISLQQNMQHRWSSKPADFRSKMGIFVYFKLEDAGKISPMVSSDELVGIEGSTPSLGNFKIHFKRHSETDVSSLFGGETSSFVATTFTKWTELKETILSSGAMLENNIGFKLGGIVSQTPNFIVLELGVFPKFTLDIVYEPLKPESGQSNSLGPISSSSLTELILNKRRQFNERFREVFRVRNEEHREFAQAVFSNLIGGIGYFYGESLVASKWSSTPVKSWKAGLYTAVPSRSFFPRGFLWDEGFHQLAISKWDVGLTREIMTSWLNLMNSKGWIAREQILGEEARSRVPEEFVVQNPEYANPPSLLLTVEAMLDSLDPDHPDEIDKTLKFFEFAFPRLQAWYNWFNTTQTGSRPGSYRWRGRNETTDRELNPKTLTSGLDDYPRASHPSNDERHVDLYCWMAYASGVLARVAEEVGENPTAYRNAELYLKDNALLDELHWSEKYGIYADYGRHTDTARLQRQQPSRPLPPGQSVSHLPMVRVFDTEPRLTHVDAFGYVSLFPLMLRIVEPSSPKLSLILDGLRDPKRLWTDYGVRSLSLDNPIHAARNTEHDPPYWRGAVWINMNYLILKALTFYGRAPGPYQDKSIKIAQELKHNLVTNMYRQWRKTGHVFEQYVDGEGKGSHPFTGWSSLIVLILSDFY
ncbi:hypothetical protein RvY_08513 [Ramazzottius varieornatus]|uniref:Mannosyl-oligosaccharide glucosidase n=1 Tax=Ramazzottius varieornatus TaxID=947166 RepID=A0A1D1VBP4_RAMVA|nr:hypothetical protein RvY_08513 [Ramazzottius varieornatus]